MMTKKILTLLISLCLCIAFLSVSVIALPQRLVDNADLLSDYEERDLCSLLDSVSTKHSMDIVIVTTRSTNGASAQSYADDFYDYNGYADDGILLLVDMGNREWHISTCGYGITAITDAGRDYIADEFVYYLSDGDYAEGFTVFAELCDEFITQAESGNAYDVLNMPKSDFSFGKSLLIALIVGFVTALVVTGAMKAQLKTVSHKSTANDYMKSNSLELTERRDIFLYRRVDRRAKPKDTSSSGGGSRTHVSSSGRSHGGGGGRF